MSCARHMVASSHPRRWCRQSKHTTRNDPADAARSWSGCSTHHPRTDPPRARHLLAVHRDDHPLRPHRQGTGQLYTTDWAGSSSAAPYRRTRSCTIAAASTPAGIPTICRWSPMPRTWHSSARRIASMGTRCQVTTSGSTPRRDHESAGHAFGRTNGGSGQRRAEPGRAIQASPARPADLINPVARAGALILSSSASLTARSWDDATQSLVPAGCSPGQLTAMSGAAVSAAPNTSERFASARRRPKRQDDHDATEHRR